MRAVKYDELCSSLGLNPRDYCYKYYDKVRIQGLPFDCGLVMIDKPKLINSLLDGMNVIQKEPDDLGWYDRIIDASGADGGDGNCHLTFQVKATGHLEVPVVYVDPEDYFSLLWGFPLGEGVVHWGIEALAGCRQPDMDQLLRVMDHYSIGIGDIQCACKSKIWCGGMRVPIIDGNIWRIGESAGLVDPISGSGISPALISALSAYQNWDNPYGYIADMMKKFTYIDQGAKVLKALMGSGTVSYGDMVSYLMHRDLRGINLSPVGILRLGVYSREFRKLIFKCALVVADIKYLGRYKGCA
jgi:hypothetical protein